MPAPNTGASDRLAAEAADLSAWLRQICLPLWLDRGIDRQRGGFHEALDLHTHRCAAPFRRLRVAARQVVVFSHAHRLGVPGAADAVQLGLEFLHRHAAQTGGGYAWRFDLDHRPTDLRRDLYDHAFVLLALASAASVVGKAAVQPQAEALMAWLQSEFAHPQGGFAESLPPSLPRRQNPHMHLLEAALAAHAAFGGPAYISCARTLVALFTDRLLDGATFSLPEYYDDALVPIRHDGAFLVEPGHHCEWVWLLHQAQSLGVHQPNLPATAARLMAFVDAHGTDPTYGDLAGEVHGTRPAGATRLWPQTERLRAECLQRDQPERCLAAIAALRRYLRPDGLWHERRGADGAMSMEPAPASSLYHLTGAILALEEASGSF